MLIDVCIPTMKKGIEVPDFLPINRVLLSNKQGLANARNDLMQKVETDWFLFLDDDIIINKKWWNKISKYMIDNKVGAVNGFGLSNNIYLNLLRHLLLFRGLKHQRGFTSNTLIRTKAVKDIVLKRKGRLEDMELQQNIKSRGYKWKFCLAYCKHTKQGKKVWKEALQDFSVLIHERGLLKAIMSI